VQATVKTYTNGYVANRVLKQNVGFLLADGPGHAHEIAFDVPAVRVAEDVDLAYVRGTLLLSRTKEGILVQGDLHLGLDTECNRCLDGVLVDEVVTVEELYVHPATDAAEYSVGEDAMLDLGPLIRAEAIIADAQGNLCRDECKGLCPNCGTNWNHAACSCADQAIDPRMAALQQLLQRQG
jgi:uncharacterized protein